MSAIETPEAMAHRLGPCRQHTAGECPSPFYATRVDAIRERDEQIAQVLYEVVRGPEGHPLLAVLAIADQLAAGYAARIPEATPEQARGATALAAVQQQELAAGLRTVEQTAEWLMRERES